jgi:hypothetical protein
MGAQARTGSPDWDGESDGGPTAALCGCEGNGAECRGNDGVRNKPAVPARAPLEPALANLRANSLPRSSTRTKRTGGLQQSPLLAHPAWTEPYGVEGIVL